MESEEPLLRARAAYLIRDAARANSRSRFYGCAFAVPSGTWQISRLPAASDASSDPLQANGRTQGGETQTNL